MRPLLIPTVHGPLLRAQPRPRLPGAAPRPLKILALLERPEGASLAELKKATGWQTHSLRGFLSGILKKKMGVMIHSAQRDNGDRIYRVRAK